MMFEKLLSRFQTRVSLRVEGLNLDRLIKDMTAEGFRLYNLKRVNHRALTFDVPPRGKAAVIAYLKKMCYNNIEVTGEVSFMKALKTARVRAGLIAGLVICAALIAVYDSFIWRVEITGIENITKAEVNEALAENKVAAGMAKKDVDRRALSDRLSEALDKAAGVTVYVKGVSLFISVNEAITGPDTEDENGPRNLYSMYDGIVTRVVTLGGTALVTKGDVVKKGEPVIGGYITDEGGNMTECRAAGQVYARVWHSASETFFTERMTLGRTGKIKTVKTITLRGLNLTPVKKSAPYTLYETETDSRYMFDGNILPLKAVTVKYYELKEELTQYNFEDEKDNLMKQTAEAAALKVPKEAVVLSSKTDVNEIAGGYLVTSYVETEQMVNAG